MSNKNKLKLRNANLRKLVICFVASCAVIIVFVCGLVLSIILDETKDNIDVAKVFLIILFIVWVIYGLSAFIFYKTIIITEESIMLKKRKKVIWTLDKKDILVCEYLPTNNEIFYTKKMGSMTFRINGTRKYAKYPLYDGKVFLENTIYISLKTLRIMEQMGYNITIIGEEEKT